MKLLHRTSLVLGGDLTLGTLADRVAAAHGERAIVEEPGWRRLTAVEAADLVARWSRTVAERVGGGDRVVVAVPNSYGQLLACLAVSRTGAVAVPVNARMRDDEVDHVVDDSGAAWVVRDLDELDGTERLAAAVPADPGAVAAIFYTSGTTGRPKGARLTHRGLVGQAARAAAFPSGIRNDLAVLSLPVAHIMGFAALTGLAVAGINTVFLPAFDASAVLDTIETRNASLFVGVPAMYRMLLDAGAEARDLRSVRVWASGADAMPPDLARRFRKMGAAVTLPGGVSVGDAVFLEGWGMVETGGGAMAKIDLPVLDAVGLPLPGYRLKVVDDDGREVRPGQVGELLVRGPGVLEGYHGDEEATAEAVTDDGWLRTGDLARRGLLGTVSLAGRKKDVVKSGGYSVFPAEVERALEEHPDVAEAAVVGVPDARLGEVPAAAVRAVAGRTLDVDEVLAFGREHLAPYKAPRRVIVVDELPRTGTEKVQKDGVRALLV
jgi:acyl-CoA synthetase (AMP-forming)/AMP-acid ligase II